MIARVWHGWTSRQNADAYERHLRTKVLPASFGSRATGGLTSFDVRTARR